MLFLSWKPPNSPSFWSKSRKMADRALRDLHHLSDLISYCPLHAMGRSPFTPPASGFCICVFFCLECCPRLFLLFFLLPGMFYQEIPTMLCFLLYLLQLFAQMYPQMCCFPRPHNLKLRQSHLSSDTIFSIALMENMLPKIWLSKILHIVCTYGIVSLTHKNVSSMRVDMLSPEWERCLIE